MATDKLDRNDPPRRGTAGCVIIDVTCPDCDGAGWVSDTDKNGEQVQAPCQTCCGGGTVEIEDISDDDN